MFKAIIGALRANLTMNSVGFEKGSNAAQKKLAQLQRKMRKTGETMSKLGRRATVGFTVPFAAGVYKSVKAAEIQQKAIAKLDQALKSMGRTGEFTSAQLQEIASKLQDNSLYGDEEIIQKVTANLLTFGNVTGDVFLRAQKLSLDLSAALRTDLQSSAIMVGKALNDPVQGLTALTRVGVSFTDAQKDMIRQMAKAGDVAGAQALMLEELSEQYSGQAEALAKTDAGKITQAMNAIGDAAEKVGAVVLPILADLAGHVKKMAERFQELSPVTQKFIVVSGSIAAVFGPVLVVVGSLISALAKLAPVVKLAALVVGALTAPALLAATAIGALGVLIYKNWERIKVAFPGLARIVNSSMAVIREGLSAFSDVSIELTQAARLALEGDLAGAWSSAQSRAKEFLEEINALSKALLAQLVQLHVDAAERIVQAFVGLKDRAIAAVKGLVLGVSEWMGAKLEAALAPAQSAIDKVGGLFEWLYDKTVGNSWIPDLVKEVGAWMGQLPARMGGPVDKAVGEAGNAFQGLGETVGDTFEDIGQQLALSINNIKSWGDAARAVGMNVGRMLLGQAANKAGGFLGDFLGGFAGGLPGFKTGGAFTVGGNGGLDSQLVQFRATPGERVEITRPGQELGRPGGVVRMGDNHWNIAPGVKATDVRQMIAQAAGPMMDRQREEINQMIRMGQINGNAT